MTTNDTTKPVRRGVVHVGQVELAWTERGVGAPLLLVYGFAGRQADWDGVVDTLARDRRLITYDHRGHGASSNTGEPYSFGQLTADLVALVDALDLDQFDLVGHSMGGIVALRYCFDHLDRVRSLVLVNTGAAPSPDTDVQHQVLRMGFELARNGGMDAVFAATSPFLGEGPEADAIRASMKASFDQLDPVAFISLGEELLSSESMIDRLPTLALPTTVIVGENDFALRDAADVLAAGIPDAGLVVIPNAGHLSHLDQPDAWLEVVERHLASR